MTGLGKMVGGERHADRRQGRREVRRLCPQRRPVDQDAAAKLDAKELGELGEDAREFVRKSPGLAVGMAAVAGFMLARMFGGGSKD